MFSKKKKIQVYHKWRRDKVIPSQVCQHLDRIEEDGWVIRYIFPENYGTIEVYCRKLFLEEGS